MRKSKEPKETESLGGMIRAARVKQNVSLRELEKAIKTKKCPISQSYLWAIEENKKLPSMEVAEKIAKRLGIDVKTVQHIITVKAIEKFATPTGSTLKIEVLETLFTPKDNVPILPSIKKEPLDK